jgi:hypothetical protein
MSKKRAGNDVFQGNADGEKQSAPSAAATGWQGPTGNVMIDDFGLDIAVESVPIPSCGVAYPVDHPLHNQETVDIRAMTAHEEDILTSRALIKKGTVISELLRSCFVDKRINPDSLLIGDRNAIMTALRITGYGSDYGVEVDCPACGERSTQQFNLAALPIKRLSVDPIANGANIFEAKLDEKLTIRYRYLTGDDETRISQINERKKKQGMQSSQLITTRYQHQIVSVNGIEDRTKIGMFIQKMPSRYSLALRKHMDENEPGIEMKGDMTCPHCFEGSEVSMPLGAAFFWPDVKS